MHKEYNFKVGDLVIQSSRWHENVRKVEKVTPTGRVKVGSIYYYNTGSQVGGDVWDKSCIVPATEEMIDTLEKKKYADITLKRMHDFRETLSHEDALAINKILSGYMDIEE